MTRFYAMSMKWFLSLLILTFLGCASDAERNARAHAYNTLGRAMAAQGYDGPSPFAVRTLFVRSCVTMRFETASFLDCY
jgi:hypothetical protein